MRLASMVLSCIKQTRPSLWRSWPRSGRCYHFLRHGVQEPHLPIFVCLALQQHFIFVDVLLYDTVKSIQTFLTAAKQVDIQNDTLGGAVWCISFASSFKWSRYKQQSFSKQWCRLIHSYLSLPGLTSFARLKWWTTAPEIDVISASQPDSTPPQRFDVWSKNRKYTFTWR